MSGEPEPEPGPEVGYLADLEAPCVLASTWYRIDEITVPITATETYYTGLNIDLDPQERVDAAANTVLSLFFQIYAPEEARDPILANIDAALADGRVDWLIEEQRCADGADDHQRIGVYRGTADGDGFAVLADAPPAVGTTETTPSRGAAWFPASLFLDVTPDLPIEWSRAEGLTVEMTAGDAGDLDGRLGIGIVEQRAAIGPALARFFTGQLAAGTSPTAAEMDTDEDGVVTADEVYGHEYVGVALTDDVDLLAELDGELTPWFRHDGDRDAFSFGVGFHAVPIAVPQR